MAGSSLDYRLYVTIGAPVGEDLFAGRLATILSGRDAEGNLLSAGGRWAHELLLLGEVGLTAYGGANVLSKACCARAARSPLAIQAEGYGLAAEPGAPSVPPAAERTPLPVAPVRTGPLFENASQSVGTRARELQAAIPVAQQGRITMSVAAVEDANGVRSVLVSSSEPHGLRPDIILQPGEIAVRGRGHAEANIIAHAQANNLRVIDIGATRPVCVPCQDVINPTGANISTALRPRPGN